MDAAQLRSFNEAIRLILGASTKPAWLEYRLKKMVDTIRSWREAEARAPVRSDMRMRLNKFRDAVETLKEGVSDPSFNVFLGHDWLPANMPYLDIVSCFDDLSNRANRAVLKLEGRGGPSQAYPTERDESLSAMELCAWTVMHAIMLVRQLDAVGADNSDAQEAANRLWQAAGGAPLGSQDGSRPPTGWREHFISAKRADKAGDRRSDGLQAMLANFQAKVLVEIDEIWVNVANR